MQTKGYKKLRVYDVSHELVKAAYQATTTFPRSEIFGLVSQMRRAAVSVVANILEGQARSSKKEFRQFLFIANGSLVELEYYFELARDLGYLSESQYSELDNKRLQVGSLLGGFIKSLTA